MKLATLLILVILFLLNGYNTLLLHAARHSAANAVDTCLSAWWARLE